MRKKARFSSLPTASGAIARAAYSRALEARLEVEPLLKSSSLTPQQIKNSQVRMPVKNQIRFLSLVAKELPDPFLGIQLAEGIELCEMGLPYYALRRLARYSGLTNEGVRITCHEGKDITVKFEYVGVSRLSDHHQILSTRTDSLCGACPETMTSSTRMANIDIALPRRCRW